MRKEFEAYVKACATELNQRNSFIRSLNHINRGHLFSIYPMPNTMLRTVDDYLIQST